MIAGKHTHRSKDFALALEVGWAQPQQRLAKELPVWVGLRMH